MILRNSSTHWGLPGRALHWISAAMIIFMIIFGVWMAGFTERSASVRLPLYGLHAWVGLTVLALLIARLFWRAVNVTPSAPANSRTWQKKSAVLVHWLLYLLVAVQCCLGWVLVGTFPADALQKMSGIDVVPMLIASTDRSTHEILETLHGTVAMTILAIAVLHVVAALHHHIFLKNDVLSRMWHTRKETHL